MQVNWKIIFNAFDDNPELSTNGTFRSDQSKVSWFIFFT